MNYKHTNIIRSLKQANKLKLLMINFEKITGCMTMQFFKESVQNKEPPENISIYLKALWYDAKNDWETSHKLIQDVDDKTAAWIHAYLHRKGGDISNADYWYKIAGKKRSLLSLEGEWEEIATELI